MPPTKLYIGRIPHIRMEESLLEHFALCVEPAHHGVNIKDRCGEPVPPAKLIARWNQLINFLTRN